MYNGLQSRQIFHYFNNKFLNQSLYSIKGFISVNQKSWIFNTFSVDWIELTNI